MGILIQLEVLSDKEEALRARNREVLDELVSNIKVVIEGIDYDLNHLLAPGENLGVRQVWETFRDILITFLPKEDVEHYFCIFPESSQELREFIEACEKYIVEIDCVIERDLPNVSNPRELVFNIKMFCKDYLWGILNIMESNPSITREEMERDVEELDGYLTGALIRRAGYDDSLDDT